MGNKLNKAKRDAAAEVLTGLFLAQQGHIHTLRQVTVYHPADGSGMAHGLTDKERELVDRVCGRMHADAELLRKMSHRLRGKR